MTAAWRSLLDYMSAEERRTLLDTERAAMLHADALRAAGFALAGAFDDAALDVLAAVLVEIHGTDPMALV